MAGVHPLRGPNIEEMGVRFPPLSDAYDLELRRTVHNIWNESGLGKSGRRLHEGVYAFLSGPTYVWLLLMKPILLTSPLAMRRELSAECFEV